MCVSKHMYMYNAYIYIYIYIYNFSVVSDNNLYFLYLHIENCLPAFFILFLDLLVKAALHHHLTLTT